MNCADVASFRPNANDLWSHDRYRAGRVHLLAVAAAHRVQALHAHGAWAASDVVQMTDAEFVSQVRRGLLMIMTAILMIMVMFCCCFFYLCYSYCRLFHKENVWDLLTIYKR